ncbi:hypothetical protein EG329_001317 [Mollisiaceae sp. DMI_Dod_QoI]|nr:hypothetical protein EG329_001317 [Helotiales sp. DMI_Dod_QoI]
MLDPGPPSANLLNPASSERGVTQHRSIAASQHGRIRTAGIALQDCRTADPHGHPSAPCTMCDYEVLHGGEPAAQLAQLARETAQKGFRKEERALREEMFATPPSFHCSRPNFQAINSHRETPPTCHSHPTLT